jgi:hypothetical protein
MFNEKIDNITCPSDGKYGYINCLSPNLNPGKIDDLNYKNTYSFCVLNTDNGSEYSDFIDCNDQNITNNYNIKEFINTLQFPNDKKYILELGKYIDGKIENAKIKEDSIEYDINIKTNFDTNNNLMLELKGDQNASNFTSSINHTFKVFPTYLLVHGRFSSSEPIRCEKIKV